MISDADLDHWRKNGFVRIKGAFKRDEILALRKKVEAIRARAIAEKTVMPLAGHPDATLMVGDVLGFPELKEHHYVLFDDRVVSTAKRLLGDRIVYFGDSSIQTGEGLRGWHKDNIDRQDASGLDWQGDYMITQFGLYLQDHAAHGGGLKLRIGSHKLVSLREGEAINVPSEIGDLMVWSSRITHSGNVVRLKACPSAVLSPRLERLTPRFLRVPPEHERMVIFMTFGAPGPHVDRYIEFEAKREDCRAYWKRACITAEIRALAEKQGVELREPIPEYGSLHPLHQKV